MQNKNMNNVFKYVMINNILLNLYNTYLKKKYKTVF